METSKEPEEKMESLNIEQNNKKYMLTIKIKGDQLILVLSDTEIENLCFSKKMTFKEIKELDNFFNGIESCKDFSNYLKELVDEKKLNIIKKEENFSLNFTVKYFSKKNSIELILSPEAKNNDELTKSLCKEIITLREKIRILENKESVINELKTDNDSFKEEIKNLKEEIKETKKLVEPLKRFKEISINKYTTFIEKSVIMNEDELNFIKTTMKYRINKEIKELKKLYQAKVDGDSAQMFHSKCDGIQNTLVIIKSAGNRRFGGFTTKKWCTSKENYYGNYGLDKNAFLFSLDNQKKFFPYKGREDYNYNENRIAAISNRSNCGPIFGGYAKYGNNGSHYLDNNFDM